jgi:chromosome segregation ATPase
MLAELTERRSAAQQRVDELERQQREAGAAREQARAALIELERRGDGSAAERTKLEKGLSAAEQRASEPWPERIEGGRRGVRDVQAQLQTFTAEHLDELVQALEASGEAAAAQLNAAAEALVEAFTRREAIAREISALYSTTGARVRPGDVSFSRAEPAPGLPGAHPAGWRERGKAAA